MLWNYISLRFARAGKLCLHCRYLKANIVYLLYMIILVYVDQGLGYHESYNENEHAAMGEFLNF